MQGLQYYRLKQTDFDGKFSYSEKVPVDFSEKNDIFYLQPNPANDEVALIFSALENSTYRIQIYHADGVCCLKSVVVANSGMNQTKLDISVLLKQTCFTKFTKVSRRSNEGIFRIYNESL